jgi:hypothetical protein
MPTSKESPFDFRGLRRAPGPDPSQSSQLRTLTSSTKKFVTVDVLFV